MKRITLFLLFACFAIDISMVMVTSSRKTEARAAEIFQGLLHEARAIVPTKAAVKLSFRIVAIETVKIKTMATRIAAQKIEFLSTMKDVTLTVPAQAPVIELSKVEKSKVDVVVIMPKINTASLPVQAKIQIKDEQSNPIVAVVTKDLELKTVVAVPQSESRSLPGSISTKSEVVKAEVVSSKKIEVDGEIMLAAEAKKHFIYEAKSGDNLTRISEKYGTTVVAIMAMNPDIKDQNVISIKQKIVLDADVNPKVKVAKKVAPKILFSQNLSGAEKVAILQAAGERKGIPWNLLGGLAGQESGFGAQPFGDGGRSRGIYHISSIYHPEVTLAQAMDWEWSTNWACDYLNKLGFQDDPIRALRLWNGRDDNPRTLVHVQNVIRIAKRDFGFDNRFDRLIQLGDSSTYNWQTLYVVNNISSTAGALLAETSILSV